MRPKQVYSFHVNADIKQCLHISKVHLEMKELMNKSKKTAPSWSYILTHLVTIDKFFKIWSTRNAPSMDQQFFVVGVSHHLVIIRGQMVLSAFGSIVLFKFWHLNLGGMTTSGIELHSLKSHASEIIHTFDLFQLFV